MSTPDQVADRLHSVAIRLLRHVRSADPASRLGAPRLSALSVIVHAGPLAVGELAAAEQVRPPTMTRIVQALEAQGLVRRDAHPKDARIVRIAATGAGRRLLAAAKRRRIDLLVARLQDLDTRDLHALAEAVHILEGAFGLRAS